MGGFCWRRGRDSNPRWLITTLLFESSTLNHSDTSPSRIVPKPERHRQANRASSGAIAGGGRHTTEKPPVKGGQVHAIDGHSNKSALIPPPLTEVECLAHRSRLLQPDAAPATLCGGEMGNLRRRLAPLTIAKLVARYSAGEHTPALSQNYGISKTGLLELLRAEGVPLRKRSMTAQDTERAVRLYESGLTIDEVVKQVGYSYSTIQRALHSERRHNASRAVPSKTDSLRHAPGSCLV